MAWYQYFLLRAFIITPPGFEAVHEHGPHEAAAQWDSRQYKMQLTSLLKEWNEKGAHFVRQVG